MKKLLVRAGLKRPIVQISVVVAAIHTSHGFAPGEQPWRDCRALKVVVEKVSLRVALMQGSVGPKCEGKPGNEHERESG